MDIADSEYKKENILVNEIEHERFLIFYLTKVD